MSIDATEYRAIMGNFATGVTVVTTALNGRLHAFTANSVTSVSLEPMLLLVCVDKRAVAHGELENAGRFGVSILASDQRQISDLFARTGEPEEGSLRGVRFRMGPSGAPLIEGSLATLECAVEDILEGGDHTIFVGRVTDGNTDRESDPLLYFRGGYRRLADD